MLKEGWANYRDESFVRQYPEPAADARHEVLRLHDDGKSDLLVKAIHNERGYHTVRTKLADQYDVVQNEPEIEVVDVDLDGDRKLMLQHRVDHGILTAEKDTLHVLQHLADLWGYEVMLSEVEAQTDTGAEAAHDSADAGTAGRLGP